ncbi:MAG: dihydrodipicolinate synthase family protein [Armatimonadota bacterium]
MATWELRGIVPPMVTPLHADETVDEAGLERQLERLVRAGVHGLFFLGSTGEQPSLRDEERRKAIRAAHRANARRVPLIVGTMASSTARTIDQIREAEAGGADAVAVTPPYYYPTNGPEEQLAHYRACAAATALPVIVYNIPSTTKVQLAPETIARIAEFERVIGVKDSSADFVHFLRVLSLVRGRPGFGVMVGTPPLAGAAVLYGAAGAVPGVANLDPRTMLEVYAAAVAGDTARLIDLQERVHQLMAIARLGAPPVCFKTALEMMGVCGPHAARPFQPLGEEARRKLASLLEELELL